MTRLVRILFLISLACAIGLSILSLNAHAQNETQTQTATASAGSGASAPAIPREGTDYGKDTVGNFIEDYSATIFEASEQDKVPVIVDRESEVHVTEVGLEEKTKTVVQLGGRKSGRNSVTMEYILNNPQDTVHRLKIEEIYKLADKAEQARVVKDVIIYLERKNVESTTGKHVLYIDNAVALNQGGPQDPKPIQAVVEAIAAERKLPMIIDADAPTYADVFFKNKSINEGITVNELKPASYDAVIYKLRELKPIVDAQYRVYTDDSVLAEIAKIAVRYYSNRPLDAAESLLKHAANRTAQEVKEGATEARKTKRELKIIEAERNSVLADYNRNQTPELKKRLDDLNTKLEPLTAKQSALTMPDPTIEGRINSLQRQIDNKNETLTKERGNRGLLGAKDKLKIATLEKQIAGHIKIQRELRQQARVIQQSPEGVSTSVTVRTAQLIASEFLKLPLKVFSVDIQDALKSIRDIKGTVLNQDHIIDRIAIALASYKTKRERDRKEAERDGVEYKTRPIYSSLLAGSTGTGKTEIVKQVAKKLGIPESEILRFDMSEYMEKHSVSRMIGAPPGYVGFEDGGLLTNGVLDREYRVILFDEIEKAHPDLFKILMQVLDEGHLTDGQGRKVLFNNTIIFFTTNLGQEYTSWKRPELLEEALKLKQAKIIDQSVQQIMAMSEGELRLECIKAAMRTKWEKAQVARLDDVFATNNHTKESIADITRLMTMKLAMSVRDFDGIKLVFSENIMELVEGAYTESEGARGVKAQFKRQVEDRINLEIGMGNLKSGDVVVIDYHKGTVEIVRVDKAKYVDAVLEGDRRSVENRQRARESILREQGAPAAESYVAKYSRIFDSEFMVRNATAKILKKLRL